MGEGGSSLLQKRIAIVLVALILFGLSDTALPHRQKKPDPDDTESPLDLKRVSLWHSENRIHSRAALRGPVKKWMLRERGVLYFHFDTTGGPRSDYYVDVRPRKNGFAGIIHKFQDGWPRVGRANVARPQPDTIVVDLLKDRIHAGGSIRWIVVTGWDGDTDYSDLSGWSPHQL